MNWKALGLAVLSMVGFIAVLCGFTWIGVEFGIEYVLLPMAFIGGIAIFYVTFEDSV
jgi:hypothetical protein